MKNKQSLPVKDFAIFLESFAGQIFYGKMATLLSRAYFRFTPKTSTPDILSEIIQDRVQHLVRDFTIKQTDSRNKARIMADKIIREFTDGNQYDEES